MIRLRPAAVACALVVAACRIEDHTPTGSRSDDEAIQHVLTQYTQGLSARDWPAVRSLFWEDATYQMTLPTRNLVLPIDSARPRLLPRASLGTVGPSACAFSATIPGRREISPLPGW